MGRRAGCGLPVGLPVAGPRGATPRAGWLDLAVSALLHSLLHPLPRACRSSRSRYRGGPACQPGGPSWLAGWWRGGRAPREGKVTGLPLETETDYLDGGACAPRASPGRRDWMGVARSLLTRPSLCRHFPQARLGGTAVPLATHGRIARNRRAGQAHGPRRAGSAASATPRRRALPAGYPAADPC